MTSMRQTNEILPSMKRNRIQSTLDFLSFPLRAVTLFEKDFFWPLRPLIRKIRLRLPRSHRATASTSDAAPTADSSQNSSAETA